MRDILFVCCIIGSVVLLVSFFIFGIMICEKNMAIFGEIASIEQLRTDSAGIKRNSEDVIGQVTMVNQKIKVYQRYNKIPVIELVVPDRWDEIETIKMPDYWDN